MGNSNNRTLVLGKMLLQPVDTLCIQVVGGLIQQQYIGFLQQQTTKCNSTPFTTGKVYNRLVSWRATECIHGTLQLAVQVPGIGAVYDILQLTLTGKEGIHLVLVLVVFG